MKTKLFTLLAIVAISIVSCDKVDDLLTFNISHEASLTINSSFPINSPIDITTPDVTTNSSASFKNNNTNADLVKKVILQELKLTITSPINEDFSFLKSIHLYISTDDSDEIELAYMDNINSTANSINLICTKDKLDKYIKAPSFKLRSSITTREVLTEDVKLKVGMKFSVTANPL